jgi:hypothetical protein
VTQGAVRVRALVAGYSALILDSPHVANQVSNLRPELRAELRATRDAIRRAAADFDLYPSIPTSWLPRRMKISELNDLAFQPGQAHRRSRARRGTHQLR